VPLSANFPTLSWLPQTDAVVAVFAVVAAYYTIFFRSLQVLLTAEFDAEAKAKAKASGAALKMPLFVD